MDRRVSDAFAADRRIYKEIEYIFFSEEKKKYSISMFILLSAAYVSLARRSVDRLSGALHVYTYTYVPIHTDLHIHSLVRIYLIGRRRYKLCFNFRNREAWPP